jgi:hypothetical protein
MFSAAEGLLTSLRFANISPNPLFRNALTPDGVYLSNQTRHVSPRARKLEG